MYLHFFWRRSPLFYNKKCISHQGVRSWVYATYAKKRVQKSRLTNVAPKHKLLEMVLPFAQDPMIKSCSLLWELRDGAWARRGMVAGYGIEISLDVVTLLEIIGKNVDENKKRKSPKSTKRGFEVYVVHLSTFNQYFGPKFGPWWKHIKPFPNTDLLGHFHPAPKYKVPATLYWGDRTVHCVTKVGATYDNKQADHQGVSNPTSSPFFAQMASGSGRKLV